MLYKPMSCAHVTGQLEAILYKDNNMNVSEVISNFPDYAKDIKLNYSKIINEGIFEKNLLYSIIYVSVLTTKANNLLEAVKEESKEYLTNDEIEDIYGAYSVMSMNAIYYRFTHLATEFDYFSLPANLRMQYLTRTKMQKSEFEMLCLAVAVIIGCGKCINAHEQVLRNDNISNQKIQTVARIASVVNAVANVMRVQK